MAPYIYHKHGWSLSADLRNQPILKQTTHKVTEKFSLKLQQRLFDSGSINLIVSSHKQYYNFSTMQATKQKQLTTK